MYAAIEVDLGGHKDIFGLWAGDWESANLWYAMLTNFFNRRVVRSQHRHLCLPVTFFVTPSFIRMEGSRRR